MKITTTLMLPGALSVLPALAMEECKPAVEVFQLQDVSATFEDDIDGMIKTIAPMIASLQASYPRVRYGVASFSDKGMPHTGIGRWFGAWAKSNFVLDECYDVKTPITDNVDKVQRAFINMRASGGADFEEAQLDAMLNAILDPDSGFTPGSRTEDNAYPLAKMTLLITDAFPHKPGFLQEKIDEYNAHFGVDKTVSKWAWSNEEGTYEEWLDLRAEFFANGTLKPEDVPKFDLLSERYMPYMDIYPPQLVPFEYNAESYFNTGLTCHQHDYPDIHNPAFGKAFTDAGVFPIVLSVPYIDDEWAHSNLTVADADWEAWVRLDLAPPYCPNTPSDSLTFYASCAEELWTEVLSALNVPSVLQIVPANFSPEDLIRIMEESIVEAVEHLFCIPSLAATTTSTTSTTTSSTTSTTETTTPVSNATSVLTVKPILIFPGRSRPTSILNSSTASVSVVSPTVPPVNTGTTAGPVNPHSTVGPSVNPDTTAGPVNPHSTVGPSVNPDTTTGPVNPGSTVTVPGSIFSAIPDSTTALPIPDTTPPVLGSTTIRPPPPPPSKQTPATHAQAESTTIAVVEGGSGLIIGAATAGVLAAGAAVAGVMYLKGMFASSASSPTLIQDVEAPQTTASREVMEQVTADMFT